jgi:lysyl-tRNA synthetase class 2
LPFSGIAIDPAVARDFPDARVGWLIAGVSVAPGHPYVENLKRGLAPRLASLGVTDENIAAHPDIAGWRAVYGAMGVKPSKFRSSPEALVRRVIKGKEMWNVSSVVDCYDCASAYTLLSMGAHDTAKIDGRMTLRYCREGEKFYPLGTDEEVIDVDARNIAYADENKILCWLWNYRDTRLAAVTEATKEALFIVDAAFVPTATTVENGLEILWEYLSQIGCSPKEKGIVGG